MLEIAAPLLAALDRGRTVVVATVVGIDGSAPRGLGTSMAWDGESAIASIAGGCVEGATVEVAERVLDDGRTRVVEFGIPDSGSEAEAAIAVGLSCGGRLRIHLAALRPEDAAVGVLREAAAGRPARLALTRDGFDAAECADPELVDERVPAARIVILGAMDFAAAASRAAQAIGYRVTVCDPRELFLTPERFPGAELVLDWPTDLLERTPLGPRDALLLLGHDDRYDADALLIALRSEAFYVGAMGSRRTDARRGARLARLGASPGELDRLRSPIGLDLGAVTPDEVAVSILAELLQVRAGATALPLRELSGPLHARAGILA